MRIYILSLMFVASVFAGDRLIRDDLHYGDPELVEYINSLDTTWKVRCKKHL